MSGPVYMGEQRASNKEMLASLGKGARIIEFAVGPDGVAWTPQMTLAEVERVSSVLNQAMLEGRVSS